MGINVMVASAAQLGGPVVGGLLTGWLGWSGVLWLCVPFALTGFILSVLLVPARVSARPDGERFDGLGAVLSVLALSCLVLAMKTSTVLLPAWGWVVAAVTSTAVLVWWQRRCRSPLVHPELFRNPVARLTFLAVVGNSAAGYAIVLLASPYLQIVARIDATTVGLLFAPTAVCMILGSLLAGILVARRARR